MMYLLGGLSFLIQILCILHVIRTGREQIWIWIILIGSFLGCTAYFAFELMPEIFGPGSKAAQISRRKEAADPVRRLNDAEAALAQVETAANHLAVADAFGELGTWRDAAHHYARALDCMHGPDPKIEKKLAEALFEAGEAKEALEIVERQEKPVGSGEGDRLALLRARIIEHLGRDEEALAVYADVSSRLTGEEALCRLAALSLKLGRNGEARSALEEVSKRLRPGMETSDMHRWALGELERLRAG